MSELLEWLVEGCQKLKHGQCTTRRCVVRGGYSGSGGYDPEIATCEEKELADMLADRDRLAARVRELEEEVKSWQRVVAKQGFEPHDTH